MIRTCDVDDRYIGDKDSRCGRTFDDAKRLTICPHPLLASARGPHGDTEPLTPAPGYPKKVTA